MSRALVFVVALAAASFAFAQQPLPDKAKADAEFWANEQRQERQRVRELQEKARKMPDRDYSKPRPGSGDRYTADCGRPDGKCLSRPN
jgi:hypothetical protein